MTAFPPIIDSLGEKNDVPIHLSRASQEIIDLIEFRLPQKGLDETIRGLFPDFLELRLKVGQWIIAGNNLERRSTAVHKKVQELYQSEDEVGQIMAEALDITSAISKIILKQVRSKGAADSGLDIPFHAVEALEQMPNESIRYLAKMIKCSLFFDGLVFVHHLWQTKKLDINLEELSQNIRSTASHSGAYCTIIGLWQPKDEDERQIIRNIKILAAHFRSKMAPGRLYKFEDLEKMAAN